MPEGERLKVYTEILKLRSKKNLELINITSRVREVVSKSGIKEGACLVFSMHTTTGLLMNEAEPGLEKDIPRFLRKLVPEKGNYYHHHYLHKDGRMAVNAWAHLRSILLGLNLVIPVKDGQLLLGGRENIYLVELDGPQQRNVVVQVWGT